MHGYMSERVKEGTRCAAFLRCLEDVVKNMKGVVGVDGEDA
jgi:hypothetical protein